MGSRFAFARSAALALLVAMAGARAWLACETPSAPRSTTEVDPGPTFGVEVTVAIKGRGRVLSVPTAIDCPSQCFARIVLAEQTFDGSDLGLSLTAEATPGSHFAGWSYDLIAGGARARGPSQCSPMIRSTSTPPVVANNPRVALHYGETTGTPPPGFEAECADFTTLPVAYALTANFVDEDAGVPPSAYATIEQLFEPPQDKVTGREIGVAGGTVYWRFEKNGQSGIAGGPTSGGGEAGTSDLVVPLFEPITAFDVDGHVLYRHGIGTGTWDSIIAGFTDTHFPVFSFQGCAVVTSDAVLAYCRYTNGGNSTSVYSAPTRGGNPNYVTSLPGGSTLEVDEERFYFTDEPAFDGGVTIRSQLRPDGGVSAPAVTLATGQNAPRELSVGPANLFWIDNAGGTFVARWVPKGGGSAKPVGVPASNLRFLVADPRAPTILWMGLPSPQPDQSSIIRASVSSGSITALVANLPSLGGIAVDATHVYWTQTDGRVFRAPKP